MKIFTKNKIIKKRWQTVLAHGIYLTTPEIMLLAERGTSVSHCPNSNTNLQSGLCNVKKLVHYGVTVGLGTGTYPNMLYPT